MGLYGGSEKTTSETNTTSNTTNYNTEVTNTSETFNYDAEANKRAMDVLERQQSMSEDQWKLAKELYKPYEQAMVQTNMRLLPLAEESSAATMKEGIRDIEQNRVVKDALRETQLQELGLSKPVMSKFYDEALKGEDVNQAMGEATADVQQAFKGAEGELNRTASRMGLKVTASNIKDLALQKAKQLGFARTSAREKAEDETFNKLVTGMQVRGTGTGLPGISSTGGNNQTQYGGYNLSDPTNSAISANASAASGYAGLAGRVTSKEGTSSSSSSGGGTSNTNGTQTVTQPGGGIGDFLGGMVGNFGGSFAGTAGSGLANKWF